MRNAKASFFCCLQVWRGQAKVYNPAKQLPLKFLPVFQIGLDFDTPNKNATDYCATFLFLLPDSSAPARAWQIFFVMYRSIRPRQEGWLYLAVVMDLFSRKIVGWSMGSRMKATLVCDALNMAIWQRKPSSGLIFHSDRGTQYASYQYRNLLMSKGYIGSMSNKGDCWDNSVIESFFGRLKQERVQWRNYQTRWEAQ